MSHPLALPVSPSSKPPASRVQGQAHCSQLVWLLLVVELALMLGADLSVFVFVSDSVRR